MVRMDLKARKNKFKTSYPQKHVELWITGCKNITFLKKGHRNVHTTN